jgi:hypothetical protein
MNDVEIEEEEVRVEVEERPSPGDVIQITDGKSKGIVATIIQILEDQTVRCSVKSPNEAPIRFRVPLKFITKIGRIKIPISANESPAPQLSPQQFRTQQQVTGMEMAKDYDGARNISMIDQLQINQAAAAEKARQADAAVKAARL